MTGIARQTVLVIVDEQSKVGEARRLALGLAQELGFDETRCGKAALVVTEAATNLLKYSNGGALILQSSRSPESPEQASGLEILAIDSGPGITDLARCSSDGFSTSGTPGNGLGAIKRLADSFDIYSQPEMGTALWARFESLAPPRRAAATSTRLKLGVVNVAVAGEEVCGDDWVLLERDGYSFLMVVDGLGHGLLAAEASAAAVRVFLKQSALEPDALIQAIHSALRSTRGAAVAVARIDAARGVLRYAGVGNIAAVLASAKTPRPRAWFPTTARPDTS